jgi:ATP-binding cassette subfamily E protein 1
MRIAVIDKALCRPSKCNRECVRFCPINRSGSKCVWIDEGENKARIAEELCVGCGICVKKCPYAAISIVNLPEKLRKNLVHRYGANGFELFRLPVPKEGKALGILGSNGVGKTTSLKILGGVLKPNLGMINEPPEWDEIVEFFKGSELQTYFQKLSNGELRVAYKPQAIDALTKVTMTVGEALRKVDEKGAAKEVAERLGLAHLWSRPVKALSGGELQKLAIAATVVKDARSYLIDEPASYLDVRERLRVAGIIRELAKPGTYLMVVEHDLAVLDYISDLVAIIYGEPGVYGVVGTVKGVRSGINTYIEGYLKEENIRFREYKLEFYEKPPEMSYTPETALLRWSNLSKTLGDFKLEVHGGEIHRGEVIGILGPNGIGKTTFVKILAGILEPDSGWIQRIGAPTLSYKPQFLGEVKAYGTVREFLRDAGVDTSSSFIQSELIKPLRVHSLLDNYVEELSGGELQRVMIIAALGREADLYLLDEPMAYLDVEQRYAVARVVKRLTAERGVSTFVVEHDVVAIDFLSNTIMVFEGEPGRHGIAHRPMNMRDGMNSFLRNVGVTFRRDPETKRPRINKPGSWLDRYQKEVLKEYYYVVLEEKEAGRE